MEGGIRQPARFRRQSGILRGIHGERGNVVLAIADFVAAADFVFVAVAVEVIFIVVKCPRSVQNLPKQFKALI